MTTPEKQEYMRKYRAANKIKLAAQDKKKTQERRVRNKLQAIEYLGGKCNHCEIVSEHRVIYDFHHLDSSEKEADPGSLMHYGWERIKKELDKCILLCANCHRIEHGKEQPVELSPTKLVELERDVESPCVGKCSLDFFGICRGCRRTKKEITAWTRLSNSENQQVIDRLK